MKAATIVGAVVLVLTAASALAQSAPANSGRFTEAQIRAFLDSCSEQANARGLNVGEGFAEARRAFRRECMHKLGVDPVRR